MTEVRVDKHSSSITHDLSLTANSRTFGLKLVGGAKGVQENSQTASTIHRGPGGTQFGDWDPQFTHLETRDASGGRGLQDFSLDPSRFYDSLNAFTMLDKKIYPAPQWKFASGFRTTHENLWGNMNWQRLHGDERYAATKFTVGSGNLSADNLNFWIRRVGSPGALTYAIYTHSGSSPNTLVSSASGTVTVSEIKDEISQYYNIDLSAASDLSSSTAYWVVIYGASTDSEKNHWQVGVDSSGSSSKDSADGSSWATAAFSLYYRLTDTDIDRKWHFFEMTGAFYAIDQRVDGGTSVLYMNGERGDATSGGGSTLTDSTEGEMGAWTTNLWTDWWIYIVDGTGTGQFRKIASNDTNGVITVDTAWGINPDNTSTYVIYGGSTWQALTIGGNALPSAVCTDVAVFNGIAVLAYGSDQFLHFVRYDSSAHTGDISGSDARWKADLVWVALDPVDGAALWLARNKNSTISRMDTFTWGNQVTGDLHGKHEVGSTTWPIIGLIDHEGELFIFKSDGMYTVAKRRANKILTGLNIRSTNNGEASMIHSSEFFFSSAGFALVKMVGRNIRAIGPDKGTGMPAGRTGAIVDLLSHAAGFFACLDAGDSGTSALMFRSDAKQGWHELFRAWKTGARVQKIRFQDNIGRRPILWMSVNGEIVYQEWPKGTLNPLEDTGLNYQHESYITFADMDMRVSSLPKLFREVALTTKNLVDGTLMIAEYQVDNNIGGTEWINIGAVHKSDGPGILTLNRGEVFKLRLRIRMLTNVASTPPILLAAVTKAYSRTPIKYQWNLRIQIATNQTTKQKSPDHDPDEFLRWLKKLAGSTTLVTMRSRWDSMDNIPVLIEPPGLMRRASNVIRRTWRGDIQVVVREV